MATGRCSGCGFQGSSRSVRRHQVACAGFAAAYAAGTAVLDPVRARLAHRGEAEAGRESRTERDTRLAGLVNEPSRVREVERWSRRRPLLDDED